MQGRLTIFICAFAGAIAGFLTEAHEARASDFLSPRASAIGGAGHAGPMLNDAIYQNPSYAALLPDYSVSANYLHDSGEGDNPHDYNGHMLNLSIQDGRSELFQAGAGLTFREDSTVVNIGAARAIVKRLGVGLGAKILFPKDNSRSAVHDMMFSTTFVPMDILQLAFVVDNLVDSDDARALNLYREYILGTKLNLKGICLIYFDPHLAPDVPDQSIFGYEAGLELPTFQDIYLRMGAFRNSFIPWEDGRGRGYSVGLGWVAPRVSFDYAYVRALEPVPASANVFGMTIYF